MTLEFLLTRYRLAVDMVVAVAEDSVQAVVHLVVDEVAAVAEEVNVYT